MAKSLGLPQMLRQAGGTVVCPRVRASMAGVSQHRVLVKGDQQRIWAYHDGADLGGPALARIARDYGYTLHELRKL